MKKRSLKTLELKKVPISRLNNIDWGGVAAVSDWSLSSSWCCIIKHFTEGECVDTLGDEHCPSITPDLGW